MLLLRYNLWPLSLSLAGFPRQLRVIASSFSARCVCVCTSSLLQGCTALIVTCAGQFDSTVRFSAFFFHYPASFFSLSTRDFFFRALMRRGCVSRAIVFLMEERRDCSRTMRDDGRFIVWVFFFVDSVSGRMKIESIGMRKIETVRTVKATIPHWYTPTYLYTLTESSHSLSRI